LNLFWSTSSPESMRLPFMAHYNNELLKQSYHL